MKMQIQRILSNMGVQHIALTKDKGLTVNFFYIT